MSSHWRVPAWRMIAIGLLIGCAQSMIVIGLQWKFGSLDPGIAPPSAHAFSERTIKIWIFLGGLIQVPLEEWLFRGVVLKYLSRWTGPLMALIVSSASFALAHWTLSTFVEKFAFALTLGVLYLKTGSLWPSIVAHYAMNATTVAMVFGLNSVHHFHG